MAPQGDARDDLRRRLYGPGATEEDVARYLAAAPAAEAAPPAAPIPVPARRRVRAWTVGAIGAIGAVGVVVVAAAAAGVLGRSAPAPRPLPSAPVAVRQPVQTRLPIPSEASASFVRELDAGREAGIAPYLLAHPDARPSAISTVGRADSVEYRGDGIGTIALEPSALAAHAGRLTVLVTLDEPSWFEWRATRGTATGGRAPERVAGGAGVVGPGQVGTATVAYDDGAPTALTVLVGEHVRWGALVVFTD